MNHRRKNFRTARLITFPGQNPKQYQELFIWTFSMQNSEKLNCMLKQLRIRFSAQKNISSNRLSYFEK